MMRQNSFLKNKSRFCNLLSAPIAILLLTSALVGTLTPILLWPRAEAAVTPFTDFNGDGFADLAVGAPGPDLFQGPPQAGAVNVIYGSSSGLSATKGRTDQVWTQDSPNIEDSAETQDLVGDQFGHSLATDDFNNDGYTDLAIGVPGESVGTINSAGAANVIYGSSQGLRASAVGAGDGRADQIWTQDSTNVEDNAEANDLFGNSLAAGDFNNDGFADLAIGVPLEDLQGINGNIANAGAVNVIYGASSGLSATAALPDRLWFQTSAAVQDIAEGEDRFGYSLAAGDFNNDGFEDLAVGVRFEDFNGISSAGEVNIIYGSSSGLSATPKAGQNWAQDTPDVEGTGATQEYFGSSLAVDDFNNDGFADLATGAPGIFGAGEVNVIYGSSSGLSATVIADQLWSQDVPDVEGYAAGKEYFGTSLATGHFNDDAYADLAVGVRGDEIILDILNAGAVNVIYGSGGGLSATAISDQLWHQGSLQGTPEADRVDEELSDQFGYSLAAGDFDNDGRDDLVVGVPFEDLFDINDNLVIEAGAINVIYGSSSGLSATAKHDQVWHQNSQSIEDTMADFELFGWSAASS